MNKKIDYTTTNEQIKLLKSKGLIFNDEKLAHLMLSTYGYFNTINSYKSHYIHKVNGKNYFNEGVTFEQILSLYMIDHELRSTIMIGMLEMEEHLKAVASDIVAKYFGTNHHEYLKLKNYRDKSSKNPKYNLKGIINILNQNIYSNPKHPTKYYVEHYDSVPPWVLFKNTYFSDFINFIQRFKSVQKEEFIQTVYHLDSATSKQPIVKESLTNFLSLLRDYRNLAAHCGRIYTFKPIRYYSMLENKQLLDFLPFFEFLKSVNGVGFLLVLLQGFNFEFPAQMLQHTIIAQYQRHCYEFPNDAEFLEEVFGIHFVSSPDDKNIISINPLIK